MPSRSKYPCNTVNDDESEVETVYPFDCEVVAIDRFVASIVCHSIPPFAVDNYFINVIFFMVQVLIDLTSAHNRDVVFA